MKCSKCYNFRCLANQGLWWCDLNKDMNSDKCDNYDEIISEIIAYTNDTSRNNGVGCHSL